MYIKDQYENDLSDEVQEAIFILIRNGFEVKQNNKLLYIIGDTYCWDTEDYYTYE